MSVCGMQITLFTDLSIVLFSPHSHLFLFLYFSHFFSSYRYISDSWLKLHSGKELSINPILHILLFYFLFYFLLNSKYLWQLVQVRLWERVNTFTCFQYSATAEKPFWDFYNSGNCLRNSVLNINIVVVLNYLL